MSKHTSHSKKDHVERPPSAEVYTDAPGAPDLGETSDAGASAEAYASTDAGAPADGCAPGNAGEPLREAEASGGESGGPGERAAALEAQLAQAQDQYLRKAADFENFRKRITREKQEAIEFANQNLLLDLIPIIDDLERAVKAAESGAAPSAELTGLLEGIGMIEKRLVSQLEHKWGLKRFDSAGELFDPTRHEAIMVEKSGEITEPVVQEDLIKGYTLKDRIIRSAKVKVLMPDPPRAEGGDRGDPDSPPA